MKSMECTKAWLTAIAVASLVPRLAHAQPAAGAQPPLPPSPPPPPATTAAPTPLPPSPAPPAAPEPESHAQPGEEVPDHERFVGHIGVTYFDIASLPVANPVTGAVIATPGGITSSTVSAPVVGVRYWFHRDFGVDVGIGAGYAGGSQETVTGTADNSADKASTGGFAFHGGLPIAFFHGKHYTFLLIPQFTVGVTTGSFSQGGVEQDLSGFLFDGGAAVGAEIHFGFIGIPELALQATVGLSYRRSVFKWKSGNNSFSDGTNTFGTNVSADPWAIFKDTISATYYF